MIRHWAAAFAALLLPSLASAQAVEVNGTLSAQWTAPQLVSPSADLVLRPGHSVTISLSGKVDLNQEQKSKRDCSFFGLSCERVYWTEHHWAAPDAAPAEFQIRLAGSGTVVASQQVGSAPVTLTVPTNADFATKYELVAILAGSGTAIDPARSAGSYNVLLNVDAQARATALAGWLSSAQPTPEKATSDDILDHALLEGYRTQAAQALRAYAANRFPLAQQEMRPAHGLLLRKAAEIAPDDLANALAVADYYRALGLTTQADAALNQAITSLQGKTDARSRVVLGQAYSARADVVLASGGGIRSSSVVEASAYLAKAIAAFQDGGRRDLLADALVRRARLLRGMRSEEALIEAIAAFRRARDLTPEMVRGRQALESIDGKQVQIFDWTQGYAPQPIGKDPDHDAWIGDAVPMRWDPKAMRMLEATVTGTYQWRPLAPPQASEPASIIPRDPSRIDSSNGSVLATTFDGRASYASRLGIVSPVPFGTIDTCPPAPLPAGAPAGSPSSPFVTGSLSRDDDLLAVYCNKDLYTYSIDTASGTLTLAGSTAIAPQGGANFTNISITAGPKDCGVAVAMVSSPPTPGAPWPKSITLIRADGSRKNLDLPALPAGLLDISVPSVAFTGDGRILVLQGYASIASFKCSDLTPAQGIALQGTTLLSLPKAGNMAVLGQLDVQWLDGDELAVASMMTGQVFVINTASNSVQSFSTEQSGTGGYLPPLISYGNIFLPPQAAGAPPRAIRVLRKAEARPLDAPDSDSAPALFLPGTLSESGLLAGGRYLLSHNFGGRVRIVDLNDGSITAPPSKFSLAAPTNAANGWSGLKLATLAGTDPVGFTFPTRLKVASVETFAGTAHAGSLAIPDLDSSERAAITGEIQKIAATVPNPARQFPGLFPPAELKDLVQSPDRLVAAYMEAGSVLSLASSGRTGAWLLCPMLLGKAASGEYLPIPINTPPGTLRPLIVNFAAGTPSLVSAPQVDCGMSVLVDGDKPALVTRVPNGAKFTLKWTRGGVLIDGGEQPGVGNIIQATALDDGSLLLLLGNASANNANDALIRLLPGGGQVPACSACMSIPVEAAAFALTAKVRDEATGRGQFGIPTIDRGGIVQVDRSGKVLARPDGDETVIQSLVTGKELIRFRLGRVLVLRSDLAIVDNGGTKLEIHRF
jgi:tetratricopeptide (TPR) repeat protein